MPPPAPPSTSPLPLWRRPSAWVAALGALGAGLRVYGLDVQSLWHDELFSWLASAQPDLAALVALHADDVHPPGHAVLLRLWSGVFGASPSALRGLSALAGVATLPLLYLLGRSVDGPGLGMRMTLLGSLAWMPLYYAQEARPYAALLLATVGLAAALADPAPLSRPRWAGALLAAIAAPWLHYFGWLAVGTLLCAHALRDLLRRRPPVTALAVGAAAALAWAPWLSTLATHVGRGEVWIPPPTLATLLEVLSSFTQGYPLPVITLVLAGAALAPPAARSRLAAAAGLLVVPIALAWAVSLTVLPVITDRNLIVAWPAGLALVAMACGALDRRLGGLPLVTAAVAATLLVDLFVVRDYYQTPTKPDYRGLVERLVRDGGPDTPTLAAVWHPAYLTYYADRMGQPLALTATSIRPKDRRAALADGPPRALLADPITPRRARRCGLTVQGYDADCEQLLGWDYYTLTRDASAQPSPR